MRLDFRTLSCAFKRLGMNDFVARKRPGLAILGAVLALGAGSAARAQTTYAPGGLFVHPTAFTPKAHQYSIYAAAFTQDQERGINNSYYPFSLTYSPSDRLQVSGLFVYHQAADDPSHTHEGVFLKYQILPDTRKTPAFAIAGAYVGNDHLESSVAGVFSHAFLRGTRVVAILHAGAKWGRTGEDDGNVDDVGGFVGAQLPMSRQWSLVGETSTRFKFDRSGASSVGVMYEPAHGPGISLGLVNGGRSSRMKLFFGVAYPFGH